MAHKIYQELAEWYPLLTLLDDYKEEADYYHEVLSKHTSQLRPTMLELGSGAGYNAYFLKEWYDVILSDLSEICWSSAGRLIQSLEHIQGDMRELRLNLTFDVVFIHDAICYMQTEGDLRKAIATAAVHCKPGGIILISPDYVKEIFKPHTNNGGEDGNGKAMRWLEWVTGPNADGTYYVDFIIALRERSQ